MTKKTFDLYRCEATEWADLTWGEALHFRIAKAKEAKLYYKAEADKISEKNGDEVRALVELYTSSDDAVKWNREWLEEIEMKSTYEPYGAPSYESTYNDLVISYMDFYRGHFVDEYANQNKLRRMATAYAIENTAKVFRDKK